MSNYYVHPTAVVDEGVEIGSGTRVWHFAHLSARCRVGSGCTLGQNVFVAAGVRIGDRVKIQNNVSVYEGVEIDDDVFLGPSCVFTNVNAPRAFIDRKREFCVTRLARGASIGANATVVCGHDVGPFAFVGAGAVVTRDVPAYAVVVGNPARRIGWACACGARLPEGRRPRCPACGDGYAVEGEVCSPRAQQEPAEEPTIPLVDVGAQNGPLLPALRAAFDRVAAHGRFILGDEVTAFEEEIAAYLGVPHAIGVSSGTDALLVSLMALGIGTGDEVITTPFSFVAAAECIARLGARPVFVDIDPASYNIDTGAVAAAINSRTKAILPVHLFGQPCDIDALLDVARKHDVTVVEDAAQAIGARTSRGRVGALGRLGCFSFHPSKNLGAFGDAGLVTTTDAALAREVRALRMHGADAKYSHEVIGGNFRLDALQAAILRVKLPHLDRWTAGRKANAERYTELFTRAALPAELLSTPRTREQGHVWNQYVIRTSRRAALRVHLSGRGIGTEVYYPSPLHLQASFASLGYSPGSLPAAEKASREVLALPVFPDLGEGRLRRVVDEVVECLRREQGGEA